MKYLYTPYDIAVFLWIADLPQSDERAVLHDIWGNNSESIPAKFRKNENTYRQRVRFELSKFDGVLDDLDELNLLMRDTEHACYIDGTINEQGIIEIYFKVIKLELTYIEGKDYRKIKLRRLLKYFGYKRRSVQLVTSIQRTLNALTLKTYLRDYVPCDIADIDINDMVMIRLK